MANDIAVRVRGVSHQFGAEGESLSVRALADTSLDIARGELLCLIGPSGCGKSTLLNVIGGLLTPTAGSVSVGDTPVRAPLPREIAYGFQENALFPWSTVIENVKLGMTFQGVTRPADRDDRARKSLQAVGLIRLRRSLPGSAFGRHAPARGARSGAQPRNRNPADGRAVRRARRADPHGAGRRSFSAARQHREDYRVRDPQPRRSRVPGRPRRVFSARPGTIKEIIAIEEPHPRKPAFMTSEKFTRLRNTLFRPPAR